MKVLFLDIDGVLNSKRTGEVLGYGQTVEKLDVVALKLVQKAVESTGSIVVLSSNWKFLYDHIELGKKLKLPILFTTGDLGGAIRGREIQEFIDSSNPIKYAILDDDSDMLKSQMPFFVKVDKDNGVSYENYLDVIKLLN